MIKNWETTIAGIAMLLIGAGVLAMLLTGNLSKLPSELQLVSFATVGGLFSGGIGLLRAKDSNKEAAPPSLDDLK